MTNVEFINFSGRRSLSAGASSYRIEDESDDLFRLNQRVCDIEEYLGSPFENTQGFESRIKDIVLRTELETEFPTSYFGRVAMPDYADPDLGRLKHKLVDGRGVAEYLAFVGIVTISILLIMYSVFFGRLEYIIPAAIVVVMQILESKGPHVP